MIILTVALAVVAAVAFLYPPFRRDVRAAQKRIEELHSQIADTVCGPIEYAKRGEGYPVLAIHGIFGGFDQGLVLARGQLAGEFRVIAPSRLGYLRTPLPEDASPAAQADAFACLLDALDIERAAVIGTSAGGTSAIQFALRHPDRCSALVLTSSNAPGTADTALPPRALANLLFRSNFIFWLLVTYFPSTTYSIMGVPPEFELTPGESAEMAEVAETLLPVAPRTDGALFDMYVSNPDINRGYPLDEIAAPTLIVHAQDDPLAAYENARTMAEAIPGAELVTLARGGHPLLGQDDRIQTVIASFLYEQTPDRHYRPAHQPCRR